MENGKCIPITAIQATKNKSIFGSGFVDELKKADLVVLFKSQLVAQYYADE